jgi:hypothetical protein
MKNKLNQATPLRPGGQTGTLAGGADKCDFWWTVKIKKSTDILYS